jgi:hypothetical protein
MTVGTMVGSSLSQTATSETASAYLLTIAVSSPSGLLGHSPLPTSQPRCLLNPSPDLPANVPNTIPPSHVEHDHSWKWVSRCYLACIQLSRAASDPQRYPTGNELADKALDEAKLELEEMIRLDDDKIILTLNQTLMVLHMHNQGEISNRIMYTAMQVCHSVLGSTALLSIITKFLWLCSDPKVLRAEHTKYNITSDVLRSVWEGFVNLYAANANGDRSVGELDLRSLGAMYIWGYMVNLECSTDLDEHEHARDQIKIREAETILRRCYELSKHKLGKSHLLSIQCLINIRLCLTRQVLPDGSGRLDDAIKIGEQVIQESVETLGKSHPRRLETMRLLAVDLLERDGPGDLDYALQLYRDVLIGRITMLGRNHRFTYGMREDYEALLKHVGRWTENGHERQELIELFEYDMVNASDSEDEINAGAF